MTDIVEHCYIAGVLERGNEPVGKIARMALVLDYQQPFPGPSAQDPGQHPRHPPHAVRHGRNRNQELILRGPHHYSPGTAVVVQWRPVSHRADYSGSKSL